MSQYNDYVERREKELQWIKEHGIKIELNKIYRQESDSWCKKHYKIIFVDDKIAVGISTYNQISREFIGDYELFNKNTGMKYNDSRRAYRLINEIENKG